jgi:acyl-CoA synthetase (AMP-forming)/AMP-acid ligase II
MSRPFNLGDLVDHVRDPGKTALIDVGGAGEGTERTYAFRELDAMSKAVARGLLRRGLVRGDRVAILSANRAEYLFAYFGAMQAGLVAVPVNFKFPAATLEHVLRDCDARLVFCDAARRCACPSGVPVVEFGTDGPAGFDALLDSGSFDVVRPVGSEPAMFLYTSGSTGKPKGVVLSHASHCWVVEQRIAGRDWSDHRVLVAAPLYHMNGLAMSKFVVAAHATIVLLPQFTAPGYIDAIGRHACTWLTSVPTMMALVAKERERVARTDTSSVRIVRMGSAPVSDRLIDDVKAVFPKALVTNVYGTTEAGPVVFSAHPDGLPQPTMSVGYPHPAIELRLVADGRAGVEQGVLEMRCPALMNGYHKLPEATRKAMTADGFYVTGDVFRRDADGFHTFVGRVDDMFVCGGENIYPGDVEKMLETHPDIEQACVVPVADEIKWQKPVAFVVLRRGAALSEQQVKAYALANAPAYQHPRVVRFVAELPLAGTNKIDRKAVAAMAEGVRA